MYWYDTRAIQKVKNVCLYNPRTCFVAADHWFLVFSVMLKSCLMQLYVGFCHVVSAETPVFIIPYSPDLAPSDFSCFQKWRNTLLVNASQIMKTLRMLSWPGWITRRPHGMKRVYKNWCQVTSDLMSKVTMWKGRQRYVPKLVYSISVLLNNYVLRWKVLYFMDDLRMKGQGEEYEKRHFSLSSGDRLKVYRINLINPLLLCFLLLLISMERAIPSPVWF